MEGSVIGPILANLFLHYVFEKCHLELNESKTKIVYCKTTRRGGSYGNMSFDFLGFTFRPRRAKDRKNNVLFTSFLPAISTKSAQHIRDEIRSWYLSGKRYVGMKDIANEYNPVIRGWVNYYGKFGKTEFRKVMIYFNKVIAYWIMKKYKRYARKSVIAAYYRLAAIAETFKPFYRWQQGYIPYRRSKV